MLLVIEGERPEAIHGRRLFGRESNGVGIRTVEPLAAGVEVGVDSGSLAARCRTCWILPSRRATDSPTQLAPLGGEFHPFPMGRPLL